MGKRGENFWVVLGWGDVRDVVGGTSLASGVASRTPDDAWSRGLHLIHHDPQVITNPYLPIVAGEP